MLDPRVMPRLALILGILALAQPAAADSIRVIDGDGLEVNGVKVRLWGIDAPELHQECSKAGQVYPCGQMARNALTAFLGATTPLCKTINQDRYGRTVARCEVQGNDLAARMVESGWALDWPRYSKSEYADEQAKAERDGLGLWQGFFAAPWEWRKEN